MVKESKELSNDVSQFQRIKDKFHYGLVFQVIRNKLAKIGIEFTPYFRVQEGIEPTEEPEIEGIKKEYRIEFLYEEDMKEIEINARGYSENELLARLKDDKKCLGLKHFNRIIAFMWIYLKEFNFGHTKVHLKDNEAYLTDMYTIESYRGKNLAPYLRFKSYDILKNLGYDKIYSVTEYFNSSAIKYKKKLNAINLKLILCINLFNKIKWNSTIKTY